LSFRHEQHGRADSDYA